MGTPLSIMAQVNSSLTRWRFQSGERLIPKSALRAHNAALKKVQRWELNSENKQSTDRHDGEDKSQKNKGSKTVLNSLEKYLAKWRLLDLSKCQKGEVSKSCSRWRGITEITKSENDYFDNLYFLSIFTETFFSGPNSIK